MRKVLSDLFKSQPDFEVVDIGRNGAEAVEKVKQHSPDVVTLDVEMPVMDGLTALEQIMAVKPTPVVMVSSLTKAGADATIKALSLGAVDFVAKSAGSISRIDEIEKDLLQKCREAAGVSGNRLRATVAAVKPVILPERTAPAAPEKPLMVEKVLTVDKAAPSMTRTTSVSSASCLKYFNGIVIWRFGEMLMIFLSKGPRSKVFTDITVNSNIEYAGSYP